MFQGQKNLTLEFVLSIIDSSLLTFVLRANMEKEVNKQVRSVIIVFLLITLGAYVKLLIHHDIKIVLLGH